MATNPLKRVPEQSEKGRPLDEQVRVSDSGQFTVSIDAVRQLPSFRRDMNSVAQIREMLRNKR